MSNRVSLAGLIPVNISTNDIIPKDKQEMHLFDQISESFLEQFQERLFPCTIKRSDIGKKDVSFPTSWKEDIDFDEYMISNANSMALKTGNGIVVIDIDTKDLSLLDSNISDIVSKLLVDKATFIVETTNGYHFYFDSDNKQYSNNVRVSDYVDIRGDGGCVFCYSNDLNSSYKVISDAEPLPLTTELIQYLQEKKHSEITYTLCENIKIADISHEYNKEMYYGIQNNNQEQVLNSIGMSLDDFINSDGLYSKLNKLAFLLALNPACPNDKVRPFIEEFIEKRFGFDSKSIESKKRLHLIFCNKIYSKEDILDIENDIFAEAYMSPKELEKLTVNSIPVLGEFVLKGQLTFIYGVPNSGKTLLLMYLLKSTNEEIYYLNADDGANEGAHKAKLAESHGYMMILCGSKDKNDPKVLLDSIKSKIEIDGSYFRDKIIIFDTVKKFLDTMNKRDVKNFMQTMRKITISGGTVILLGHTNKIKDNNTPLVFEGVGDFMSDPDCVYELNSIVDKRLNEKTIILSNKKQRGPVPSSVSYLYDCSDNILTFEDRMNTVKKLSKDDEIKKKNQLIEKSKLDKYEDLHPLISDFISKNPNSSQSAIINYVSNHDDYIGTKNNISKCLTELSGVKWIYEKNPKNNNSKEYTIISELKNTFNKLNNF